MHNDHPRRSDRLKAARFMHPVEVHEEEDGTFIFPQRASPRITNRLRRLRKSPRRLGEVRHDEIQLFGADFSDMEETKHDLEQESLPVERLGSHVATEQSASSPTMNMVDRIAGMDEYLKKLKEMVIFPLLYPEAFAKLGVSPPRGVLFHGPPGTGKTLLARLLADSCSIPGSETKVSFLMKNGSDCLSKWIGEAEKNLRKLFHKARERQPAIIFFDEIDGLAPERTEKQDQGHISLVATLLALMDGLDDRGHVVVIGATNRINALDPALRRPGRFDREFFFDLPSRQTRRDILRIHTRDWSLVPEDTLLERLADECVEFSGADLKALCVEAALRAMRRLCPRAYDLRVPPPTPAQVMNDFDTITVTEQDFRSAFHEVSPSCQRRGDLKPRRSPSIETLFDSCVALMASRISTLLRRPSRETTGSWSDGMRPVFTVPIIQFTITSVFSLSPIHLQTILHSVCRRLDQTGSIILNVVDLLSKPLEQLQKSFVGALPPTGGIVFLQNLAMLSDGHDLLSNPLLVCLQRTFYPGSHYLLAVIESRETMSNVTEILQTDWPVTSVPVEIGSSDVKAYLTCILQSLGLAKEAIGQLLAGEALEWVEESLSTVEIAAATLSADGDGASLELQARDFLSMFLAVPLVANVDSLEDTI